MNPEPKILTLTVGAFESNCYVLSGPDGLLLIDPGSDTERILDVLAAADRPLDAVLLTHGHADHVHGLPAILDRHPVPVFLHPADAAWAFGEANCIPPWYTEPPPRPADLRDPRTPAPLVIGGWCFDVIESPGHTPGGVCYHGLESRVLFSGDTLFRGSIGRTDLPGADPQAMVQSLRRLTELSRDTRIYPGHGPSTTIGEEIRTNPWL